MRIKAEANAVELDTALAEAFFAFYWLSSRRDVQATMDAILDKHIELRDIIAYHNIYEPLLPLDHFVRVIVSADNEYIRLKLEKLKSQRKANKASKR